MTSKAELRAAFDYECRNHAATQRYLIEAETKIEQLQRRVEELEHPMLTYEPSTCLNCRHAQLDPTDGADLVCTKGNNNAGWFIRLPHRCNQWESA